MSTMKTNSIDCFDINGGSIIYKKAKNALEKYSGWENVSRERAQIYHGSRKGLRIVYNEEMDQQTCVTKHQAGVIDRQLTGYPLDVRIAASIEIPSTYDNEKDRFPVVRNRQRISFFRKGLRIDLSEVSTVSGQHDDKDEENKTQYQIEFEIIESILDLDDNKIVNHFTKVFDLLKCL